MAQRPSFDMTKLSTADKILLGGGIIYLVDLFLPWNRKCFDLGLPLGNRCGTLTGWHGLGILNGILVLALIAWVVLPLLQVQLNLGTVPKGLVPLGLGAGLLLFTLLRVLIKPSAFLFSIPVYIFGWLGLVLVLAIAYGAYMKYTEPATSMAPPAPPSPGTGGPTP